MTRRKIQMQLRKGFDPPVSKLKDQVFFSVKKQNL